MQDLSHWILEKADEDFVEKLGVKIDEGTSTMEYGEASLGSLLSSMSPASAFMTKVAPLPIKCSICNLDLVTRPFTATSTQHTVIKISVVADSSLMETVDDALCSNFGVRGSSMQCGNSSCSAYSTPVDATAQQIKSYGPLMGILIQRTTTNFHPLVVPATLKLSCMKHADVNNQADRQFANSLLIFTATGPHVTSHVQTARQRRVDLKSNPESRPHTVYCPRGCGEISLSTQLQCGSCFEALPQPPTSLYVDFTGEPGYNRCVGAVVQQEGSYKTLVNRGRVGCTFWEYQGPNDAAPQRIDRAAKLIAEQAVYVLYERKDVLDYLEDVKTYKSARDESFGMAGPDLDVSVGEGGNEAVMSLSGEVGLMRVVEGPEEDHEEGPTERQQGSMEGPRSQSPTY